MEVLSYQNSRRNSAAKLSSYCLQLKLTCIYIYGNSVKTYTRCPLNLANFQIAVFCYCLKVFHSKKKTLSNRFLYTMKIHNLKCANSGISFEQYSNMMFSKEVKIWIVQNYSSEKGLALHTLLTLPSLTRRLFLL